MACDPYRLRRRQPQARIERKIEQACDPQYEVADRAEPGRIWPVAGGERGLAAFDLTERAGRSGCWAAIVVKQQVLHQRPRSIRVIAMFQQ